MAKTTLKLSEIRQLGIELNGYKDSSNNQILVKGLLNEKLKLVLKYWLTSLNDTIQKEIKILEDLRTDLIKKYGTIVGDDPNNYIIETIIDDKLNPNYITFQQEFNELLEEEKEIEHTTFKLNDISNIEADFNTPIFFKLITNEQ